MKKRRNIKDCENKKKKIYAGYVINSDKFHRTQQEGNWIYSNTLKQETNYDEGMYDVAKLSLISNASI